MKSMAQKACTSEILSRLERLNSKSERRWGRMTVHQMVCHLADACRMALGERRVTHNSGLLKRTIIKWLALYAPLRWRTGFLTSPEIDQLGGGTPPADFAADIAEVRTLLSAIATRNVGAPWPDHPVFGPMSSSQWLRWAYLHTDHHLRQFGV